MFVLSIIQGKLQFYSKTNTFAEKRRIETTEISDNGQYHIKAKHIHMMNEEYLRMYFSPDTSNFSCGEK